MNATNVTVEPADNPARAAVIAVADASLGERLARAVQPIRGGFRVALAPSFSQLWKLASGNGAGAILIDDELVQGQPLAEALRPFTSLAPVILLAVPERQPEAARMVSDGDVEFVARTGDFIPLAAALLARRIRWAQRSELLLAPSLAAVESDLGTIFRHEINNPLTGILGNVELVLSHKERLVPVDAQRLQTVVDLAVRLRESIRRLSNAFERHRSSLTAA